MNQVIGRSITTLAHTTHCLTAVDAYLKELILGNHYDQTLNFYKQELHPHRLHHFLPSIIKACSFARSRQLGIQLQCVAQKTGMLLDPVVSNSLISMYAKFHQVSLAFSVFGEMVDRDTISWNAMINCHIQNEYLKEALIMFKEMWVLGFVPKAELLASILSVCGKVGEFSLGRGIHGVILADERIEDKRNVYLLTSLVDLYMRSRKPVMAFRVFDQMEVKTGVSWTALVSGCIDNGECDIAIDYFRKMQVHGNKPNRVTLISILSFCSEVGYVKLGKQIHGYGLRHCFDSECRFSTALINMYSKCSVEDTLQFVKLVFERVKERDAVLWTSIIECYCRSGDIAEATNYFTRMQEEGIKPNYVTLLELISACASLSLLNHGCSFHGYAINSGLNCDVFVSNSLINMYAKCGCLLEARDVFEEMPIKDSISWSALINSYGQHGCGKEAWQLFNEMTGKGMEPDAMTFLAVQSACNHSGLVEEGQELFQKALKYESLQLRLEHYACHIDLLAKSGELKQACDVIRTMPLKPSTKIWTSLISAFKAFGNLDTAEFLAHQLIKSEPDNSAYYSLLSMVYGESGNWLGVEEVWKIMDSRGMRKTFGISQIELENCGL